MLVQSLQEHAEHGDLPDVGPRKVLGPLVVGPLVMGPLVMGPLVKGPLEVGPSDLALTPGALGGDEGPQPPVFVTAHVLGGGERVQKTKYYEIWYFQKFLTGIKIVLCVGLQEVFNKYNNAIYVKCIFSEWCFPPQRCPDG